MEPITLRDYQEESVAALLKARRGICKIPAGGGKTIVGAGATNAAVRRRRLVNRTPVRVVVIANTLEQVAQWKQAMEAFPLTRADEPATEISFHCFAARTCTWGADIVIIDECQHVAAYNARGSVQGFKGMHLWGFSATPERNDELRDDVFRLLGPIVIEIPRERLIAGNKLLRARVYLRTGGEPGKYDKLVDAEARPLIERRLRYWRCSRDEVVSRTIYPLALEYGIFKNQHRTQSVLDVARYQARRDPKQSVLILVATIEQGEALEKELPGIGRLVHSKVPKKARAEAIEAFRDGSLPVMLATSLADEGLDVPRASVLIMAGAGRSAARAEQRTGRVLRTWGEKTHGVIYDFWDCQHRFLLAQSRARKRTYEELNYQVSFIP